MVQPSRLFPMLLAIMQDLLIVAGLALIFHGLSLVSLAVAFVVLGALLLLLGLASLASRRLARRPGKDGGR